MMFQLFNLLAKNKEWIKNLWKSSNINSNEFTSALIAEEIIIKPPIR